MPEDKRAVWREVIVQSGDTIGELAFANGVTSQRLRSINHLGTNLLQIGQSLRVPRQGSLNQPSVDGTYPFIVQPGDSLWSIAKRSSTLIDDLARLNGLKRRDPPRVGETILLRTPHPNFIELGKRPSEIRRICYKVRRGDSLSLIATKFRVRVKDIIEWNAIGQRATCNQDKRSSSL